MRQDIGRCRQRRAVSTLVLAPVTRSLRARGDVWLASLAHAARAARSFLGVSSGLILYQACSILPFSSTRKAERMMPM